MIDTEDKGAWCQEGVKRELDFVSDIVPLYPHLAGKTEINPAKVNDKYAPDLLLMGQLADLKSEQTPFFKADEYGVDSQYAYTFNHKDYVRYRDQYSSKVHLLVWTHWPAESRYGRDIAALDGVWYAPFSVIANAIEAGELPEHSYKKRVDDTKGNAKSSYVIDLNKYFKRLPMAPSSNG